MCQLLDSRLDMLASGASVANLSPSVAILSPSCRQNSRQDLGKIEVCVSDGRSEWGQVKFAAQGFELHSRYKAEHLTHASTKGKEKLARQVFGE